MTQWEQIKIEYKNIPVPADGPHQVLQAMAEAKRKRGRLKNFTKYGTVAAAVLVVILLIPGMRLFSGGFGGVTNDSAYMQETDCAVQNADSKERVTSECILEDKAKREEELWAGEEEAISQEILRQMEKRMQNNGETYYIRSEEYPEGFALIDKEQEYYINENGLLVFVFRAGTVAPKEQGNVEFIIPTEVFAP